LFNKILLLVDFFEVIYFIVGGIFEGT